MTPRELVTEAEKEVAATFLRLNNALEPHNLVVESMYIDTYKLTPMDGTPYQVLGDCHIKVVLR